MAANDLKGKAKVEALGIVLIAHGSRRPQANADLHELVGSFRRDGYERTFAAFLELAEPTIVEAGRECVAAGATRVVLTPYFLSAGVHVVEDLKQAREELESQFSHIPFHLADPLGPHPQLAAILHQRIREATDHPS